MLFQGDAPEGSDTFQWPIIERDHVGGLRLIIWGKVKVLLCQSILMHRKRVTSELHDSYFRLMTIKHSISKIQWAIVWALNYYLTQLSSSPRSSCQLGSRQLETRCGRESHTRPQGALGNPDGVDPSIRRTRKTQRGGHNSGVKILQFIFDLQLPLTCNPWTTLSNSYNKVSGIYFCKEVFLRLPSCVCYHCVGMYPVYIYMYTTYVLLHVSSKITLEFM